MKMQKIFFYYCLSLTGKVLYRSTWVAQLVKCPTSAYEAEGHDLLVCEFEPCVGLCADSSEPEPCFRLYVSLSLCFSSTHALSTMNKCFFKKV